MPQNKHKKLLKNSKKATIEELWDSPEALLENFEKDSEYEKLLNGEAGTQVIYHYLAVVVSEGMDDWTEYVIQTTSNLIKKLPEFNEELESEFKSVTNFSRGLSHNVLGQDRLKTNPEYYFMYDIPRWLSPKNTKKIK